MLTSVTGERVASSPLGHCDGHGGMCALHHSSEEAARREQFSNVRS